MTETEILIVGGGPAGLTAAALFASQGRDVTVVDRAPPRAAAPDMDGADLRTTAFLLPSVELLRRAGVWARLEGSDALAELRVMRLIDAGGAGNFAREIADFTADDAGAERFGWNVANTALTGALTARLAELPGARLIAPAAIAHIVRRESGVRATLEDGTRIGARLLLAADGRGSATRAAMGIGARRWSYGQKALVFSVLTEAAHEGVSTEIHRSGGPFTLVPMPDLDGRPRSSVVWMETGPEAARLDGLAPGAFAEAVNARSLGVLGRLEPVGGRAIWPMSGLIADRLTARRGALIGEAAHGMPPIGAQGLNTSLADIAALEGLFATAAGTGGDIGADALLAAYGKARWSDAALRVGGVDLLNRAAMAGPAGVADVRRAGLRLLHGLAPLRKLAVRTGLGAGAAAG